MIKIYFEDEHIIVCEKPYGVQSQLGSGENMIKLLEAQIGKAPFVVHRLDTTTSGVMVYAKTEKAAAQLSAKLQGSAFDKNYLAIVHGKTESNGKMCDCLYHDKLKNKSFVVKNERKGSKYAELEFCTLGSTFLDKKELSLVKIHLLTGRTHQIRVQFSQRGNMLYGDGKYGAKDNDKIALHAYKLTFEHPVTKNIIEQTSLPQGKIWECFENEISSLCQE